MLFCELTVVTDRRPISHRGRQSEYNRPAFALPALVLEVFADRGHSGLVREGRQQAGGRLKPVPPRDLGENRELVYLLKFLHADRLTLNVEC